MDPKYYPVALIDRYTGTSTTYQKVVEWKVGSEWGGPKKGKLLEISLITTEYAKTKWRVRVGRKILFEDKLIPSAKTFPYYNTPAELDYDTRVTIEAKSTDGTSITADGEITAVEY